MKKVRKEAGVSQEQLANELGMSQSYIGRVEAGTVNLSISHIVAIAKKLNVSLSTLVEVG